jgi:hypothetical protein
MSFYQFDNRYMLDMMALHPDVFVGTAVVDPRGEAPERQIVVRHLNAHARKVFEITGLDRVLDVQP